MMYDITTDEIYCQVCEEPASQFVLVEPGTFCCLACAEAWQEDVYPQVCEEILEG